MQKLWFTIVSIQFIGDHVKKQIAELLYTREKDIKLNMMDRYNTEAE